MKVKALNKEKSGKAGILSVLKGVLVALCASLVGILLFAFVLRFTSISDKIISPVNQVIKGVSIFLGVFVALKKQKAQGLLFGLLIGIIYTIVAFLVFSILDGAFSFDKTFVTDIVFGGVIGAICGIICVNLKKN